MNSPLLGLGRPSLVWLSAALASGRLGPPFRRSALVGHVPEDHSEAVSAWLRAMHEDGMAARHMALSISWLLAERERSQAAADRLQLVCSPPEMDVVDARDTSVVVQDLFRMARTSLLIATYALDAGKKAEVIFGDLAARMDACPELEVRVIVNIHRAHEDTTAAALLTAEYARKLRAGGWPGDRLPEVFYDPRSVETESGQKASQHAKLIVADARWSLLTSANFTEAAQARNIEAGVLVDDPPLARRITRQFAALVEAKELRRLTVNPPRLRSTQETH